MIEKIISKKGPFNIYEESKKRINTMLENGGILVLMQHQEGLI
jgi:hypothetical protein